MRLRARTVSTLSLLAALCVATTPAWAGLYFEQHVTTTGEGQGMQMNVRGWAEEGKARIEFVESDNPIMAGGTYLLTTDGGQTVYLVNPKEQTYSEWDMNQAFATLGQMMQATGGMLQIDFRDPVSETLSTEPGGQLLGYPTTHYRWKSGYTMDMKVAFMDRSDRMETISDAWVTEAIDNPGLFVWLKAKPPTTGDPELDQVLTADMNRIDGMVLKMEQKSTTTSKKGEQRTSTTVMEVTTLREESVDASRFAMPTGYTETPLVPSMADAGTAQGEQPQEQAEEEPQSPMKALKGLFGKKKDG